jgi:hypothetical protein
MPRWPADRSLIEATFRDRPSIIAAAVKSLAACGKPCIFGNDHALADTYGRRNFKGCRETVGVE